jgi:hypothetical protein
MATQQYDVKALHVNATTTNAIPFRTRLKEMIVFPATGFAGQTSAYDTTYVAATYTRTLTTVTVTYTAHGLFTGQWVYLDFTSGGALDGIYQVTVTDANTFTVTTAASGTIATSNVNAYLNVLIVVDVTNATSFTVPLPGEGILARTGIGVVLGTNTTCTLVYG